MNKKLLCSTALVGALVSGAAVAEIKVGGNLTHTINLGSNEVGAGSTVANERLGTEMNVVVSAKSDLSNGMYISYKGNIEFDDHDGAAAPDLEYEARLGAGNFYIGAGSDAGNCICATPTLPAVSYQIGTLAVGVGTFQPYNYDGFMGVSAGEATGGRSEANNSAHLSLNYSAMGGTFSYIFAPNHTGTHLDDDSANVNANGGSATSIVYSGSPVKDVNVILAQNIVKGEIDTAANEITNRKYGISYKFGATTAGIERQTQKNGASTLDGGVWNYAITHAIDDKLSVGLQYGKATEANATVDEKIKALTVGYNLGAASIAVSYISGSDLNNSGNTTTRPVPTAGNDIQGVLVATRFAF